jgi:hypothetical protein
MVDSVAGSSFIANTPPPVDPVQLASTSGDGGGSGGAVGALSTKVPDLQNIGFLKSLVERFDTNVDGTVVKSELEAVVNKEYGNTVFTPDEEAVAEYCLELVANTSPPPGGESGLSVYSLTQTLTAIDDQQSGSGPSGGPE